MVPPSRLPGSPSVPVTIVGGGLAGCEAAWQLLRRGIAVEIVEARPSVQSPAHRGLLLGELVCSNSLRSDAEDTASGLLKAELRRAGSLVLEAADATRVPAGSALAVDREAFSLALTARLAFHPLLRIRRAALSSLPSPPAVLASGPLTTPELSASLVGALGHGGLYFYDAISPIVDAATVDPARVFLASRREQGEGDYLNAPMDRDTYDRFVEALRSAAQVTPRPFEEPRYFEGCLPVEVMAARGDDVLAHGPMRPVGLIDPRTGRRPYAVVQLRAEDEARAALGLVGFQTRLTYPEQARVFRMIPGLEAASFLRYGSIHRNTYLDSPRLLGPRLDLAAKPGVKVAGQISGVEGYLESTASGLVAGILLASELLGHPLDPPPPETALGSLARHVTRPRASLERFEPSNITFGLMPPADLRIRDKRLRRVAVRERALERLVPWLDAAERLGL
jgi:methylenetetrahydrofolate--tRNA-(uracil-5-)-methyltransferase